nr:SH3 domain-containing protein [Cytophagales bacterium]
MKKLTHILCVGMVILIVACQRDFDSSTVLSVIEDLKKEHAPDKRIARWDIQWDAGVLRGETNLQEAYLELQRVLEQQGIAFQDSITLLPHADLEGVTNAIVTLSVANIRSEPKHSAELATQALMGTPLKVLKKEGSWYLVQTPEGYISWVDTAGIALKDEDAMNAWNASEKLVSIEMIGAIYTSPEGTQMVSDLTAGNIMAKLTETDFHYGILLPDGRSGYVTKNEVLPYEDWLASRELSDDNLVQTAKNMMGVPYLWGGTSPKGVDCSGFTKTIYFLNGMIIPRDASQQVNEGDEVDVDQNWDNLEVGDLLFFGVPAQEGKSERVVHVGMWIGNNSFIHSRGRVRISSFDPEDENYDAYELGRYLRTKRIRNKQTANLWPVDRLIQ